MLVLVGTVQRVTAMKPFTDKETGVISESAQLSMLHTMNEDPDSALELINIKVKDAQQVEAFRQLTGKTVRFPVRTWSIGESSGLWVEKGVLPTIINEPVHVQKQPAKAA